MPIMTFWLMSGNIGRVRADSDIRSLTLAAASQSGEGVQEYQEKLVLELGKVMTRPVVPDEVRDDQAFEELRAIAASM